MGDVNDPLSVALEYLAIADRLVAAGEHRSPDVTPIDQHVMARGLVECHRVLAAIQTDSNRVLEDRRLLAESARVLAEDLAKYRELVQRMRPVFEAAGRIRRGCDCEYDHRCGRCQAVLDLQATIDSATKETLEHE